MNARVDERAKRCATIADVAKFLGLCAFATATADLVCDGLWWLMFTSIGVLVTAVPIRDQLSQSRSPYGVECRTAVEPVMRQRDSS